ncbi:MAG: hypothetical protein AAB737_03305 [Patescibacteria group bacterium]
MKFFGKSLGILAVLVVALTILERWYNIFYLGRLFDNVGAGIALAGFAVPVITIGAGIYGIIKIVRA